MVYHNYPDWCEGREKISAIDGIEGRALGAVMREDVENELGELNRERDLLDERIAELEGLLCSLRA